MMASLPRARLTPAAEVPALPLEFVWAPFIAIGRVTVVLDTTSSVTSVLTSYVTATASAGAAFPLCHNRRQAMNAIVIASRRAIRNSIRPQLGIFGAELSKVQFLNGTDGKLGVRGFASAKQADHLREAALVSLPELVVIEMPLGEISRDGKPLFSRLARDARVMGAAVVVVVSAKGTCTPKEIDRTVRALVRMHAVAAVCAVTFHASAGRFLFRSEKSITGYDIPALGFRLKPTTTQYDMPAVSLIWDDMPAQLSDSDALNCDRASDTPVPVHDTRGGAGADVGDGVTSTARQRRRRPARRRAVKLEHATSFLRDALANGSLRTKKLKKLADDAGISGMTLRRAAERLCLAKKGGRWDLPTRG